jgi:negative regulator of flagellin synthesis FlgM
MKIQAERPDDLAQASQAGTERNRVRNEPTPTNDRSGTSDRVAVSSDAQLLNSAVKAANDAPEIRADVVAAAKQKLLSGELGADADRLANRMIDHMLKL